MFTVLFESHHLYYLPNFFPIIKEMINRAEYDIFASIPHSMPNEEIDIFNRICNDNNIEIQKGSNIGQLLDALMSNLVEPKLINPTFVIDYPKAISPLAKAHRNGDPSIVERFELFIGGA